METIKISVWLVHNKSEQSCKGEETTIRGLASPEAGLSKDVKDVLGRYGAYWLIPVTVEGAQTLFCWTLMPSHYYKEILV